MDETMKAAAFARLLRKLGIAEPSEEVRSLLEDELEDAESALRLYLNKDELDSVMTSKVVALAALYHQRDGAGGGALKSSSYSEGDVKESLSYMEASDYEAAEAAILASLAKYREVRAK